MKKKLLSICSIIILIVSMCAPTFADKGRLIFEIPDGGITETSVAVTAHNTSTEYQEVWLIAAFVNNEGVITAIGGDQKNISPGSDELLNVALEDMSSTSELKYFLWDKLNGRTPMDNVAPAPPAEIVSNERTTNSIGLSWSDADDDYQSVDFYNIYNMGMKVGASNTTSFTDTDLERGCVNSYEIKAVDSEGLESSVGTVLEAGTADVPTAVCKGSEVVTDGRLNYVIDENYSYYGSTAADEEDGLACRKTVNPSNDGLGSRNIVTRHPYNFSEEYASEIKDETKFTFIMTYFDNDVGVIRMDYCRTSNGSDPNGLSGNVVITTAQNTGQWKTVVYNISDGNFGLMSTSIGNSYAKFRIHSAVSNLKIYSLSVMPTREYEEMLKNGVCRITDAYINDGVLVNLTADEDVFKMEKAEKGCAVIPEGKALECDVSDSLVSAADNRVNVEIEYYTENPEDEVVLKYNSKSSGAEKQISKKVSADGKWQRVRFEIEDASFGNAINAATLINGADFTVSGYGSAIYVHSVRVYIPR